MPTAPRRYASVTANDYNTSPTFVHRLIPYLPDYPEYSTADTTSSTTAAAATTSSTTTSHHHHPPQLQTTTSIRRDSTSVPATDADMQMNFGAPSASWRRSSGLPSYSRQFANIPEYAGAATTTPTNAVGAGSGLPAVLLSSASSPSQSSSPFRDPSFFVPSYLRNSRYVARLEAARRSKLAAAQREQSSTHLQQQQQPSLSASSSHVNLYRMAPSHRGMTYDIVEKEPAVTTTTPAAAAAPSTAAASEDKPSPLPSRWNENDRHEGLDLTNDGMEVRYMGHVHKPDHEAASVRADYPMPREGGIYYYEATILVKPKDAVIAVGFSSKNASLERLPGWDNDSWAYHGDDGKAFIGEGQGQGRPFGPTFGVNDTIGCGVNFTTGSAFFTKNGILVGIAFKDLQNSKNIAFYPSIGMKRHNGMHVRVNFGQQPFMYDIDGMVKKEKLAVVSEIKQTSTANLQPPLDEDRLLQELVAQFLTQEGYYETARAFAEEVRQESVALDNGQPRSLYEHEPGEDIDTANRQKIRAAILEGDIDRALKYTNAYFPKILQDNPHILFKLRCRKFLEMMCKCSDSSNAAAAERERDGAEEAMDVDDRYSDGEGMDTEVPTSTAKVHDTTKFHELLTEAVQYGQQLRMDYPSDEYGGDKKYLDDIFSLVAYPDPRSSVHGHYLDASGRIAVADDLNAAILISLGKSSTAALETLYSQTEVLLNELSEEGGTGAFINLRTDLLMNP
ncbi:Ran-binding protein (RanBP10), putative [Talaromyces stipitatus ATCC 10500]|uniref:Protein FYV10 n=1 Tax=Talaromyces stipitatus (strain ATCC 10500 / CBS 375.48 / QM 6759 / NRRL 1006) TaxID=441959 RepID=B8MU12_TALSN|nr:Ran-binding protein (RanBP10), putative [Talaromyces stipitatus ATCC 10500]EED12645.1 Ran-binding protein (RanBP10), putative [Talaromyces stipitatus ATCC 10500]